VVLFSRAREDMSKPKEKRRTLQIGEPVWVGVKQRALDERVTVREVVERAVHAYLASGVQHRNPHWDEGERERRARNAKVLSDDRRRIEPIENIP
jgi:hypothetical protein